jgi:hypothetical protein
LENRLPKGAENARRRRIARPAGFHKKRFPIRNESINFEQTLKSSGRLIECIYSTTTRSEIVQKFA